MKNLFLVLIIITVILSVFPAVAHADEIVPEEVVTTPEETPVETPTETPQEPPTSDEVQEVASLVDRIQEAWEKGEIKTVVSLAFDVAILIVAFFLKKATGKSKTEVVTALQNSKDKTVCAVNDLITAANDVVNAVEGEGGIKGMLDEFKANIEKQVADIASLDKEKLENYGKQLANCMATQKLVAEMLQQVYANSTTIPMSTKNIVGQKYVEICDIVKHEENTNG